MARRRRFRRFLLLAGGTGGIIGFVVAAGFVALAQVPGGIRQVDFRRVLSAGEVRYVLPNDFLEAQIAANFPRMFQLTPTLEAVLEAPRLTADEDTTFLRLEIGIRTQEGPPASRASQPGTATVRGQLKFDRATGTVAIAGAQLVALAIPGERAGTTALLLPLIQYMIGPALNGTVVFTLPREGGFWQRTGAGFVRDVRVVDGQVVIAVGP